MRRPSTRARRMTGWILSALVLTLYVSPAAQLMRSLPDRLSVAEGQSAALHAPFPLQLEMKAQAADSSPSLFSAWDVSGIGLHKNDWFRYIIIPCSVYVYVVYAC